MSSLEQLEDFVRFLHAVQRFKRIARRPDEKERTNTAEHTFMLAMVCWYIASANKLKLDYHKILKYALAHDVIEAYSGDTPAYDVEGQKTKTAREAAAVEKIKQEFPEFSELTATIHEYEERATPEAKFVYATDKLVDPLDASMETTQSIWKDTGVSWETLISYKTPKIAASDAVVPYWNELVKKLEDKKDFFFND
jgi:putative hydrolase of HD superfamily